MGTEMTNPCERILLHRFVCSLSLYWRLNGRLLIYCTQFGSGACYTPTRRCCLNVL